MINKTFASCSTICQLILLPFLAVGSVANAGDDDFVDGVQKAPNVFDGDIADRQADYVIDLISPDDPTVDVANNVLTLTANGDYGAVAKNIHFIGKGYQNPGPGKYRITVEHVRAGAVLAKGSTRLKILPSIRPSNNPFTSGQNQLLQGLDAGPILPWTFLVWDAHGEPFMNIELKKRKMHRYQLRQSGRTVGHVRIDAPDDASGFSVSKVGEFTSPTPVIGLGPGGVAPPPTQRYMFKFDAGSNPADGCYRTTFKLNNGNSWTLFVGAPTAAACADDDDDSDSDSDD